MSFLNNFLGTASAVESASVRPRYETSEAAEAYLLTVYLPGVAKENLEITGEAGELRIVGRRAWKQPDGWTSLYRETGEEPFELTFEHENVVDLDAIRAELRDGVLKLTLPKAESVKPRKISVA
ncbi:MAG TPA: Hsp20/alpha crystallin family protein [Opitutaceae bacterium]|jgi:HSP20 family molecular chaperone IbpA